MSHSTVPEILREKYGYGALTKAANAVGMDPSNLNKKFKGIIRPDTLTLFKMAECWDIPFIEVVKMFYPEEYKKEVLREIKDIR